MLTSVYLAQGGLQDVFVSWMNGAIRGQGLEHFGEASGALSPQASVHGQRGTFTVWEERWLRVRVFLFSLWLFLVGLVSLSLSLPKPFRTHTECFLSVQHLGVANSPRCSPGGRQPGPASVLVGLVPRPAPPAPSLLPPGGGSSEGTSSAGSEQSCSVSGPPPFPSPPRRPSLASGMSGFMVSA